MAQLWKLGRGAVSQGFGPITQVDCPKRIGFPFSEDCWFRVHEDNNGATLSLVSPYACDVVFPVIPPLTAVSYGLTLLSARTDQIPMTVPCACFSRPLGSGIRVTGEFEWDLFMRTLSMNAAIVEYRTIGGIGEVEEATFNPPGGVDFEGDPVSSSGVEPWELEIAGSAFEYPDSYVGFTFGVTSGNFSFVSHEQRATCSLRFLTIEEIA